MLIDTRGAALDQLAKVGGKDRIVEFAFKNFLPRLAGAQNAAIDNLLAHIVFSLSSIIPSWAGASACNGLNFRVKSIW
jgi:hypothetical protein